MKVDWQKAVVCVIGLGYVGLPLAEAFSRSLRVIGFDKDNGKIEKLSLSNSNQNLLFTDNPKEISKADFVVICVPTPLTKSKEPDLSYVKSAAEIVGRNMKKGSVVILESTVYPGVTEEVVRPILEKESKFRCGPDFMLAYSPERINPGDNEHTIDRITKIVTGINDECTEVVAELYRKITPHIFKARDIRTAEAAKVIENIQRDLNIALMNELALIFDKMNLNSRDVFEAAATKWNFNRYSPGLVGGHCIPVDPYYLVYKAEELGYHPQVILAGRAINDSMPRHIAEETVNALNEAGKVVKGAKVLIMGLTYKENVADIRETPAKGIIGELTEYGVTILGYDPLLGSEVIEMEIGIKALVDLSDIHVDCVILTVGHSIFKEMTLDKFEEIMNPPPILIDVRGLFDEKEAKTRGFIYRSLL